MNQTLRISLTSSGPARADVAVTGELDVSTVPILQSGITDTMRGHPARLTLDLSRLRFIDAAGIRALYQLHRRAAADGCALTVGAASETFWWTLSNLGLHWEFAEPRAL
jgi:anti-anti-sigma factor